MAGSTSLSCPQGHHWDGTPANGPAVCPVCGGPPVESRAVTLTAAGPAGLAPAPYDGEPTLPQSDGQPSRPEVPGFDVERELGRGGMGVVYLARQAKLNRHVALKMILSGGHAGPLERERFRIEAQAAAQLQHPSIVQIYEVGEADGRPYLALEYVPGGSLAAQLHGQPWPARDAARLVEPLAAAIHHAHQRGIIHRDLKPANILLSAERRTPSAERKTAARGAADDPGASEFRVPSSESHVPKITDFGLAKQLQETDGRAGPTHSGAVMGTPSYIAPEQASGRASTVGPGADVYSLGAILYELLTGRPPFRGETPLDTVLQVMADDPIPPRRLQPRVPRDLETICLKCLHKEPRRRYASAAELGEDLRRYLAGEPILARPVSMMQRGIKWGRRRPAAAALVAGVILAVLAALVASVAVNFELKEAAERERRQAQAADEHRRDAENQARIAREEKHHAEEAQRQAIQEANTARRSLYALELAQVLALSERDPRRASHLLDDERRCPPELRDFTWGYLRRLCRRERAPLAGHTLNVSALAFAPDDSWLASAGWDRTLRLWTPRTSNSPGVTVNAHDGLVLGLAVSPDGGTLATAGDDKLVKLWTVVRPVVPLGASAAFVWPFPRLRERATLAGHQRGVRCVAFSPDGRTLTTAGYDSTVRLWDVARAREKAVLRGHSKVIWSLAFSADGQTLASGSEDGTIKLWDVTRAGEGTERPFADTLAGHNDAVVALAFSPDGKTLASGGGFRDQSLRLWDVARRRERARLKGHTRAVFAVAFAPDGQTLASGSADGTIRLWDPTSGRERTVLLGHPAVVLAIAFSPDSRLLASGGADRVVRLWELDEHREESYAAPALRPRELCLLDRAGRLAFDDGAALKLWDWQRGETVTLPGSGSGVVLLATARDAVAALDRAGMLRIWHGGKLAHSLPGFTHTNALALSPDGQLIAAGRDDGTVRLVSASTRAEIGSATNAHRSPVTALAFAPDGRTLASGGGDREIHLWSTAALAPGLTLTGSAHAVRALAFAPNSRTLASGSVAGLVRLWDCRTGASLASTLGHFDTVTTLAFAPDGKTLASGSDDRTAKLWDAETGQERATLTGHTDHLASVAFAPDSGMLATVTTDGVLKVWRADTR